MRYALVASIVTAESPAWPRVCFACYDKARGVGDSI